MSYRKDRRYKRSKTKVKGHSKVHPTAGEIKIRRHRRHVYRLKQRSISRRQMHELARRGEDPGLIGEELTAEDRRELHSRFGERTRGELIRTEERKKFEKDLSNHLQFMLNSRRSPSSRRLLNSLLASHPRLIAFELYIPDEFRGTTARSMHYAHIVPVLAYSKDEIQNPMARDRIAEEGGIILEELRDRQKDLFPALNDWVTFNGTINERFWEQKANKPVQTGDLDGFVSVADITAGADPRRALWIRLLRRQDPGGLRSARGTQKEVFQSYADTMFAKDYLEKLDTYQKLVRGVEKRVERGQKIDPLLVERIYGKPQTEIRTLGVARTTFDKSGKDRSGQLALEPYLVKHARQFREITNNYLELQSDLHPLSGNARAYLDETERKEIGHSVRLSPDLRDAFFTLYTRKGGLGGRDKENPRKLHKEFKEILKEITPVMESYTQLESESLLKTFGAITRIKHYYTESKRYDYNLDRFQGKTRIPNIFFIDSNKTMLLWKWAQSSDNPKDSLYYWNKLVKDAVQTRLEFMKTSTNDIISKKAKALAKIKQLNTNPAAMDTHDLRLVEKLLNMSIPSKPKGTRDITLPWLGESELLEAAERMPAIGDAMTPTKGRRMDPPEHVRVVGEAVREYIPEVSMPTLIFVESRLTQPDTDEPDKTALDIAKIQMSTTHPNAVYWREQIQQDIKDWDASLLDDLFDVSYDVAAQTIVERDKRKISVDEGRALDVVIPQMMYNAYEDNIRRSRETDHPTLDTEEGKNRKEMMLWFRRKNVPDVEKELFFEEEI